MCSANTHGQGHVGLFYETIHLKDRRYIDGPDSASALAILFMVNLIFLRPFSTILHIICQVDGRIGFVGI